MTLTTHAKCIGRTSLFANVWLLASLAGLAPAQCHAHKQAVHEAISQSAALSSSGLAAFLAGYLGADYKAELTSPKLPLQGLPAKYNPSASPLELIEGGSFDEDDAVSVRSSDHFYTVTPDPDRLGQAPGLTDRSESFGYGFHGIINSFKWATDDTATGPYVVPPGEQNLYGWSEAREYQYAALIYGNPSDRSNYLATMLYALGHIIHLNQDLAQPDHVRNDEHFLPWHSWIERFGKRVYLKNAKDKNPKQPPFALLPHPGGWAYWQGQGFEKLLDFWDRGKYVEGDATALAADARGDSGAKLGLAEFSNGNFLGEDATYAEFFSPGDPHYFPLPSLESTTQPLLKRGGISGIAIDSVVLENGDHGNCVYVTKLNAGVPITHHSALHYLAVKHPPKSDLPEMRVGLTINDTNVLQEYHDNLIPKAIEYSAGILDYFFRGQLDVAAGWDDYDQVYYVQIVNQSGQDLLGGAFELYQEDSAGNRTPASWNSLTYSGALPSGGCVEGSLTGPVSAATKYVVVYRGTIGSSSGSALDPVDKDIALATKSFSLYPIGAYPAQGPRVRIQNFPQFLASVQPCPDCVSATTQPAWDGTFDYVEFWDGWLNCYPSSGPSSVSMNGKLLYDTYVWWDFASGYYELIIKCQDASNNIRYIWFGKKDYGTDATGEYVRSGDFFWDCQWHFCAPNVESVVVEAY